MVKKKDEISGEKFSTYQCHKYVCIRKIKPSKSHIRYKKEISVFFYNFSLPFHHKILRAKPKYKVA